MMYSDGVTIQTYTLESTVDETIKDTILTDNTSKVRVHCLVDDFLNPNYLAFYMTPIGVDTFYLPEIEDYSATLYGYFFTDYVKPIIRKINAAAIHNHKISWRVLTENFITYEKRIKDSISRKKIKDFRFFYGYSDGKISPLSPTVKHQIKCPGVKVKRVVSHD